MKFSLKRLPIPFSCVYACLCGHVKHLSAKCPWRPEVPGFPSAGVTGGCKPPSVGAGRTVRAFNHPVTSPAPDLNHFTNEPFPTKGWRFWPLHVLANALKKSIFWAVAHVCDMFPCWTSTTYFNRPLLNLSPFLSLSKIYLPRSFAYFF